MKKNELFLILFSLIGLTAAAQIDKDYNDMRKKMLEEYNAAKEKNSDSLTQFRTKAQQNFDAFRKKANEEYAQFMENAWKQMQVHRAQPRPQEPKPKTPPTVVPSKEDPPKMEKLPPAKPNPMPFQNVVPKPKPVPVPEIPDIPEPRSDEPVMSFDLYGTRCSVHADSKMRISMSKPTEKEAANVWRQLSGGEYDGLLHDCLDLKQRMELGDWGFVDLTKTVAAAIQGRECNESRLIQMWLLVQSGMQVRLALQNNAFVILLPLQEETYNYSYVNLDGGKYYVLYKQSDDDVIVCDIKYPKEHMPTLKMQRLPKFDMQRTPTRSFSAKHFATIQAQVSVNKNLIAFLNNYPASTRWEQYSAASLSNEVKQALYPMLREQLKGKSEKQKVNMLLDFMQYAFDYATDQQQFGRERPLYGDESFFYPYNDCEDRAILFSILVRELVGLDVVLVYYPGHLAAAVCFKDDVSGDYFNYKGRKYVVCDPTYIGATAGMAMPNFKIASATIIEI